MVFSVLEEASLDVQLVSVNNLESADEVQSHVLSMKWVFTAEIV